jgi:hypothetical protein
MEFTDAEKREIRRALEDRRKSLENYNEKYPDGGYSKEALEKSKALRDAIDNKLMDEDEAYFWENLAKNNEDYEGRDNYLSSLDDEEYARNFNPKL